ncbi:hypothetical protein G9A89_021304 [Geosiphon pyriformis]|nr:hypothetical protein G9A89_021304 [Geosiphon pyriformis]
MEKQDLVVYGTNVVIGVSGSNLTGLRTCLSAKKKCVDNVYSYGASYKKPKKPVTSSIIDMSVGLLNLANISGNNGKSVVSWKSKVGSIEGSISDLSDLKNMKNMVAKETSYTNSDNSIGNKNMGETTSRKT